MYQVKVETRTCEGCKKEMEVNPEYPHNRYHKLCFFAKAEAQRQEKSEPDISQIHAAKRESIAMMAVWRGLTSCRAKNVKIEVLISECKKAYEELFK